MQSTIPDAKFPRPGPLWLAAPVERSRDFLPAFSRISLALQTVLRERVPAAYFEDLGKYSDVKRAYPMLVYQASRPFRVRVRTDLTYDVLNPEMLTRIVRNAKPGLGELLANAESRLTGAGLGAIAEAYKPKHAARILEDVQRLSKSRRWLSVLIRAESVLMEALVELGGLGTLTPREQDHRASLFEKRWSYQLRRMYPGTDYLWLAPALMEATTEALRSFNATGPATEDAFAPDALSNPPLSSES